MLEIKFKIGRNERLYVSDEYISNCHWAIRKDALSAYAPKSLLNAFKHVSKLQVGSYVLGYALGRDELGIDIGRAFRVSSSPIKKLSKEPCGVMFAPKGVHAYLFETVPVIGESNFKVAINPNYVPLMALGECYAPDSNGKVEIVNPDTGKTVAVIMPIRQNNRFSKAS